MAAEQLAVTTTGKRIFYVYIEQCSNVYTAKNEKTYEKRAQSTAHEHVVHEHVVAV